METTGNKDTPISSLSNLLLELNPYEFNLVAMLVGYLLAQNQSALAQTSLGNFFESLGQVLETIGAQNQFLNQDDPNADLTPELFKLACRIDHIEEILDKFKKLK